MANPPENSPEEMRRLIQERFGAQAAPEITMAEIRATRYPVENSPEVKERLRAERGFTSEQDQKPLDLKNESFKEEHRTEYLQSPHLRSQLESTNQQPKKEANEQTTKIHDSQNQDNPELKNTSFREHDRKEYLRQEDVARTKHTADQTQRHQAPEEKPESIRFTLEHIREIAQSGPERKNIQEQNKTQEQARIDQEQQQKLQR